MQVKDIYFVHVDGNIGAYRQGRCPMISYAPQDKFIDFVKSIREDYPEYRLRCVKNKGIEDKVRKRINLDNYLRVEMNKSLSR